MRRFRPSERDSEVPTPQGYESWYALKTLGMPTRPVFYADEGHTITKPGHQRDFVKRTAAGFDQYLCSPASSSP